ncbi:kielin/chordin-like protein [Mytilus californianus]|uniref:kielin/chordin-like protein n=1 Tax=Mytilus californianus TaxID=6549 RepID=UPI002245C1DD|nr:kielin/chordin-like protein [Mytilus californianus]
MTFMIYILCSLFCSILCSNCDYKGATYRQEETWVTEDRCNICTCRSDGTISCETKQCSPVKCHDNGRDYNIGETFLSSDGCNECVCTVNGAACTRISCGGAGVEYTHIPRCSYHGKIYTVGDTFMSVDGCNICICTEKQVEICTKMYCAPSTLKPQETTKAPKCTYNGKIYSYLAKFNSSDGCNTCTCTANEQVACTERACLPLTTKVETPLLVSTTPQTSSSITKISTTPVPTCAYNGRIYNTGDQFKADDGCNSCTCGGNERIICTLMACPPKTTKMLTSLESSTPASTTMHVETTTIHKCSYNGRVYDYGMSFKDDDGCNICICGKDEIICSLMKCPTSTTKIPTTVPVKTTLSPSNAPMIQVTPPKKCNYNGRDYDVGVSFKADDGCNTCSCTEKGVIGCTLMLCQPTTVEANNISSTVVSKKVTCIYNGQGYNVGESFKNTDGCNTCQCIENGGIACTKMFCISTTKLSSTQPTTQTIVAKTQPLRKCNYNGHIYFVGDTFKATDGCNTCRCTGKQEIACTKIYCPPTSTKNFITDVTTPTIETTNRSRPMTTINHLKVTMNK